MQQKKVLAPNTTLATELSIPNSLFGAEAVLALGVTSLR
jgi:hypothetical protein